MTKLNADHVLALLRTDFHFLRKPSPGELVARGRMLKQGSRLVVTEVTVHVGPEDEPVAHATVTYSVPPDSP